MTEQQEEKTEELFGEADLVYSYTRAQAIEDGVLEDVSHMAQEAGFRIPVAITSAVLQEVMTPSKEAEESLGQSQDGRLWDVLFMLLVAIKSHHDDPNIIHYRVIIADVGGSPEVKLKAVCGPDDDASPCITIMLPSED